VAAFGRQALDWLRQVVPSDAGTLVTSFADRPAYLDAHMAGFEDPAALMQSWTGVNHLDELSPQLLAQPGSARMPRSVCLAASTHALH